MRLHRLEVQAFGPFAGHEVVDADALSEAGLFLLHGPTGAGKTSVLDAVSFALFGQVPGARTGGEGLRSHHADPDVATEVALEATLRGRRLRITRRPRQQRPKQRGEGMTTDNEQVTVQERVDGTWQPVATRIDDAVQLVGDALGMGADQFHQVVLLPQGAFATFLRASAEERKPLLEKLFATHRFSAVERWLDDRRKAAHKELTAAEQDLRDAVGEGLGHLRRLPAEVEPEGRGDGEGDGDAPVDDEDGAPATDVAEALADPVGTFDRAVTRAQALEATCASRLGQARTEHQAAAGAAEAARALADRQRRHREATEALARLDGAADQVAERRRRLEAAQRAAVVLPATARVARAERDQQRADEDEATARRALTGDDADAATADGAALADRIEAVVAERTRAETLLPLEAEAQRQAEAVAALAAELERRRRDHQRAEAELAELPAKIEAATARREAASAAAERLPGSTRAADDADARRTAARRRDELDERLDGARTARQAAVDAHQRAVDHHQALQQQRLDGMAAELADGLADGEPCPVCGSEAHPAPASGDEGRVTADQVTRAAEAVTAAEAARRGAEEAEQALVADRAAAHATAGDDPVDELARLADAARRTAAADAELAAGLTGAQEAVTELEGRRTAADDAEKAAGRDVVALAERHQGAERDHAAAVALVQEATGGTGTVADLLRRIDHRRDRLRAAAEAVDAADTARRAVEDARADAEATARDQGFDDVAAAVDAALDDEDRQALAERLRADDEARAAATGAREDPDLQAAAAAEPADVEGTAAAAARAQSELEAATGEHRRAVELVELLEGSRRAVATADAAVAPVRAEHARIAALADLAGGRGDNALRMTLSSYVLAARLEQVAAAASVRLRHMSGGRYTIEHTDEERDGRRKGGLGLRVLDAWSNTPRDPSSLSGGETFFASLALALGMADVVTAESGGTRIDTLFIDEGFGTLDEDTLNDVMDVLDELREGGRAVGIVSHVGDLRTRITTQLEVRKTPSGSHLHQGTVVA